MSYIRTANKGLIWQENGLAWLISLCLDNVKLICLTVSSLGLEDMMTDLDADKRKMLWRQAVNERRSLQEMVKAGLKLVV